MNGNSFFFIAFTALRMSSDCNTCQAKKISPLDIESL